TYTARSIEDSEQVVTFTLQDHRMSVGLGAPLEQLEVALQGTEAGEESEEEASHGTQQQPWLKPLALSLLERGVGPFRVADVRAATDDGWLRVTAWYRAGGLALVPVTLIDGTVDNPQAAEAFVEELESRKSDVAGPFAALNLLDYWFTWILVIASIFGLLQAWRRKHQS
ncbi:MAG: hypothetical protein PVH59_15350, partial [Anaerolineae bacterium]